MNYQPHSQTELTSPAMATGAMVLGIIGLLVCMIPIFGLAAPSLAIIFSLLGRGNQMKLSGQGLAGLIMGIVGIVGNLIFLVVFFSLLINLGSSLSSF